MNLRHLGYLVALAQERNFHKAARAAHITQPTLSSALRQLEAERGREGGARVACGGTAYDDRGFFVELSRSWPMPTTT